MAQLVYSANIYSTYIKEINIVLCWNKMFLKSLSPGHEWSVCQKYFLFLHNLDKSFIIVDLISSKNNFRNSKIVFCHLLCWCIYSIYIRWNHQLLCICNQLFYIVILNEYGDSGKETYHPRFDIIVVTEWIILREIHFCYR